MAVMVMVDKSLSERYLADYIEWKDGRATIRGRRYFPVSFVASAAHARNMTVAEIAEDYTLTETQVMAALWFYNLYKDEVDAQDARDIAEWERLKAHHESEKYA